ncbi:MAG: PEP-CTERM sorting domain-containing protein [Phycisphaerae bacterium]
MRRFVLLAAALTAAPALAGVTVDGSRDATYGAAVSVQTNGTQFGNATIGQLGFADGSELDAAYGRVNGGALNLLLTGNLESNFNKVEIFIDSVGGGQGTLRGDNPDVDFNGLNRMAGLIFDNGFEADHYITATNGDTGGGTYQLFANYAQVLTGGGGSGMFLGGASHTPAQIVGPNGIVLSMNNSNTLGVNSLGNPNDSAPDSVTTGLEVSIPLSVLGGSGPFKIVAFVNGGGHDFASNQWLGALPAGFGNLGEPTTINLKNIDGDQFFIVVPEPSSLLALLAGAALLRRR